LGGLLGAGGIPRWNVHADYYLSISAVVLACAPLGATPLPKAVVLRLKQNAVGRWVINALEPVVVVTLLLVVTAYFVDGSFSPFLYFRF
jgi:alginate O-acetyltransferase complex protein AlgI